MHKLIEYICDELDALERKADKGGKLTMTEIQYGDTLAHFKKNLLKAEEMSDEGYSMGDEYSRRGYSRYSGYSREGSYARGRGENANRDSRGRYSRDGYSMADNESMIDELRSLMQNAPDEQTRNEFKRFIQKIENI